MSSRRFDDLDAEIREHLDRETQEFLARGLPLEDARAAARRKFGSVSRVKEDVRAVWRPTWVDDLRQDLRHGLRMVRRQPLFYVVAVLTMALGMGATTALFSLVDGVLLKPLPWPGADRLLRVTETRQGRSGRVPGTISNGTFVAWRQQATTIEGIGGWLGPQASTLTGVGEPLRTSVLPVTPTLFRVLRVQPLIGRLFSDDAGGRGQPGAILLSYGLWQERFGGRADVVGDVAQLDDRPYTIVGVMPREFAFPDREARAWTAWEVPSVEAEGAQRGVIFRAIARLQAEATPAEAAAEATVRARGAPDLGFAARALFGAAGPIDVSAAFELDAMTADVRPALVLLMVAVTLLLLTATANVASLQLARATARQREMAVRAAIGAGRGRLVRQLVVENALIGLCGGAVGLCLAGGVVTLLPALLPDGFPRLDAVAIDGRAFAFSLVIAVAAGVTCAVVPAWNTRRVRLTETLAEDGIAPVGGTARTPLARARVTIIVGQVAVACVLLLGAVLLTRSFASLMSAERGYDPENVLTVRLPIPRTMPAERRAQFLEDLIRRLQQEPGVTHAAWGTALPFLSLGGFTAFTMRSPLHPEEDVEVQAAQRIVSPDYFGAMRLRLVSGRTLSAADVATTPPVVVVNRTFARQYLGERSVGARLPLRGPRAGGIRFADEFVDAEVVGVVDDMRQDLAAAPQPEIYASSRQVTTASTSVGFDPILVVRTAVQPSVHVSTLQRVLREQAPALALDSVMTMEDRVMTSLERPRLYAAVVAVFGSFALLIAGVGLYGVLSFSVAQRTREIGVRSALGAQVRDIVMLVLRQALWMIAGGLAIGVAAAWMGARVLTTLLYGISPHDAPTFVAVPVIVLLVGAAACVVPARRAATLDPIAALRG